MNQSHSSWLDRPDVRAYIEKRSSEDASNTEIALELQAKHNVPTSESSVRRAKRRWAKVDGPEIHVEYDNEGGATVSGSPPIGESFQGTPEEFAEQNGFDMDEWYVDSAKASQWEQSPGVPVNYLSVVLKRKRSPFQLIPARADGPRRIKGNQSPSKELGELGNTRLVVFVGDQQAPFHDKRLNGLFCDWLEYNQPDQGILIGDTVDYPDVSRHRKTPEVMASLNECTQAGYDLLYGYVESSPDTDWTKLVGNHDWRLHNFIVDQAPELHDIRRASNGEKNPPILSVDYLLRLDELGIEYVEPPYGNWELGQVNVTKHLAARHGWIAKKGSGVTALATLEHLGYSVVVGHTHRQSKVYKTTYDIEDKPTTLTAVEAGCMCRTDLGYAVKPDWQQGFATATLHPDGKFNLDLATYVNGVLVWRDQRYE